MPIGVTLLQLRYNLRGETNQSLNVAHGLNTADTLTYLLNRQQRELYNQYEWPHLIYRLDAPITSGTDTYNYPNSILFENVNGLYWQQGVDWCEITYGIPPDASSTPSWPIQRWMHTPTVPATPTTPYVTGKWRLWPVPNQNGTVRFDAQAPLVDMVADSDVCMLDSTAIVMFAAAEYLANQKAENAQLKLQKAQAYIRRLLANSGANKRRTHILGGIEPYAADPGRRQTPYIDYIPMT